MSDDFQFDDGETEEDDYEKALYNCSGSYYKGVFLCGAAGSEECDWECPFSGEIGKRRSAKLPRTAKG